MMVKPTRCPVCNAPLIEDRDACFKPPSECPYRKTYYPELCSLHDKIYFGTWRKMTATVYEVRRAKRKIERLLFKVKDIAQDLDLQPANVNIKKAYDALEKADVGEDPFAAIKFMDQVLSYTHHAINDLLHERGEKSHSTSDYEKYYDIILPFKEDW
jgi:hypothetical protein